MNVQSAIAALAFIILLMAIYSAMFTFQVESITSKNMVLLLSTMFFVAGILIVLFLVYTAAIKKAISD